MAKRKPLTAAPAAILDDAAAEDVIRRIGSAQRLIEIRRAEHQEALARLNARWLEVSMVPAEEIDTLVPALRAYCEAHRDRLTGGGKRKTVRFSAGEVRWRSRPASLVIADAAELVEQLVRRGLERFVRVRREPDREAMLKEPEAITSVAGVDIVAGTEDFVVIPFPG